MRPALTSRALPNFAQENRSLQSTLQQIDIFGSMFMYNCANIVILFGYSKFFMTFLHQNGASSYPSCGSNGILF